MKPIATDTIDKARTPEAIELLARAFHDDPVINWACNFPDSLEAFFDITLPPFVAHGLTYVDEEKRGVASWQGPNQAVRWPYTFSTIIDILRLGGLKAVYRMAISGNTTERFHPQTPHYYLFAIGVLPQYKGQGVGTGLISKVLRTCDEEKMPAYLENSKEENLEFYQGHGFKVVEEIQIASSSPPLWLMWRDPITE
ncbi:MAG: GNAT family N-acetyltransferase [Halioglobus sp.]